MTVRHQTLILILAAWLVAGVASAWKLDPGLAQEYPILVQALEHAKRDVQSQEGTECFLSVDGEPLDQGQDPNEFDDDDEGPSIGVEDLTGAHGIYRRNSAPDTVTVNRDLVQDAQAGDAQAFEVLVATIVHETAHWVDHLQDGGRDTPDEEGCAMEVWIYGWSKQPWNVDGIKPVIARDTQAAGAFSPFGRLRMPWPICRTAPPSSLALTVTLDRTSYSLGDVATATLTLTNLSSRAVSVVDRFDIEGTFASFDILDPNLQRVDYNGPEVKPALDSTDFVSLAAGGSMIRQVTINGDAGGYPLDKVGSYSLDATYHLPPWSCPPFAPNLFEGQVMSNSVTVTVVP